MISSRLPSPSHLRAPAQEQASPPSIVYASSSSVYGLNTKQPFSEDDRVDSPASLYAATKRVRKCHTRRRCRQPALRIPPG